MRILWFQIKAFFHAAHDYIAARDEFIKGQKVPCSHCQKGQSQTKNFLYEKI